MRPLFLSVFCAELMQADRGDAHCECKSGSVTPAELCQQGLARFLYRWLYKGNGLLVTVW